MHFIKWNGCVGFIVASNQPKSRLEGEFFNGKINGRCSFISANGTKSLGYCKDGINYGVVTWYGPSGEVIKSVDSSSGQIVNAVKPFAELNAQERRGRADFTASDEATICYWSTQSDSPLDMRQAARDAARERNIRCLSEEEKRAHARERLLPGAENAGKPGYYTVRPGDTVVRIALDAGQNWRDIMRWNNLANPNTMEVGQVLRIEPPVGAAQSFTLDSGGSTSAGSLQTAPSVQSINAGSNAIAVEVQAARQRQQELEQRLAAQMAEAEAAQRRQQELEAQLAAVQSPPQALPSAGAVSIRSAHALVIGNAAYPGSGRLDNPVNDATAISQKLRSMGFTVTMVTDANRQRLVQAMAQFRRSAASADLSLLFYSGHGVQIFGTNYILPTDVDQTDTAQATIQGVRLNEVIENFMPGKTKIVFLDACRDNPLQRTGDRSVTKGLAPISVAQGTLISYATKDGQVAADGVGSKNSPFTQALLEHLADPQDIGVVLRKVREKVMKATGGKQQPWDYGSLTGGELVLSRIRGSKP